MALKKVGGFLTQFREFAMKGNVVDLAVGVVIGTAFGKIVSSLVADIITPPLGVLIGGVDFKSLAITLKNPVGGAEVSMNYGIFFQNVFDFIIIAFALFMVVKLMNRAKRRFEREQAEAPKAEKPADIQLLEEIRDLLKQRGA